MRRIALGTKAGTLTGVDRGVTNGFAANGDISEWWTMSGRVLEEVGSSLATDASVGVTQEMVRIDSTNGKEDTLARQLEARLKSFGIGKVWCEQTYEGRHNTLWEVDISIPSRYAKGGSGIRSMAPSRTAGFTATASWI
jgi:hypothetical protein